jgi:hypothetical protein
MMTKITPDTTDDVRFLRLLDLEGWVIDVKCPCGRVVVFPYGMFQRRSRLAGTVLVADLQHLLRCSKCGRRDGFRIEIAEERERGRPGEPASCRGRQALLSRSLPVVRTRCRRPHLSIRVEPYRP